MNLSEFNAAPAQDARALLLPCLDVERWAADVVDRRPFAARSDVLESARAAARPFTDAEIEGALVHHPRIGDRAAGAGQEAKMSRAEQSGVDPADAEVADELKRGNLAYEQKFGHVFLIRAAGRSADEILAALNSRLLNSPAQEREIMAEQLREIAVLRLEGALQE
ncbi:2-oxo-4-hydroxy-4-carboxy-5-ureidoimidazoline decarboxylase [Saxibacter everestensis]|uniref:2-oxo-4-hydroxy-4-carboxy-5-ureidoimidazoline decarboxylase n=1 Tax=Saxibacter everestensis TaxID=2909229 RepID=A0ABY8QTA3_9MICO|nr:2-oxo-4-hydroxy-4-carboxy-5-ureidoimidazoline decarboxylase [Brevibacteriaceae bacterium ZFBP1038]